MKKYLPDKKNLKICVIGLGYVGLPLAIEFGKKYPTFGYDIDKKSIETLNLGNDLMDKIKVDMESVGKIELQPKFDGKQMIMVVQPV